MPDPLLFPVTHAVPITAPSPQYANVQCSSLNDFRRLLKDLRSGDESHQILFRGQTREHQFEGLPSLVPAMRREAKKPYSIRLQGFDRFVLQRMRIAQPDHTPWTNVYPSLCQHYCAGSAGLDVTFDPWIALWFACHKAVDAAPGIRFLPLTEKDCDSPPVLYVIECLKPQMGRRLPHPSLVWFQPDLEDLRLLMRSPKLRPNRQQAGMLLPAAIDGAHANACANFITYRLTLSGSCVSESLRNAGFSESYLFPSPREDYLYCWLLASRSAKRVYQLARHKRYTQPVCKDLMLSWKTRLNAETKASSL